MKRGPTEFKQDLEDIVEEETIEKLLEWVQTEFQDNVRSFIGSRTSNEVAAQNLEAKTTKTEAPKLPVVEAKNVPQEPEPKREPMKENEPEQRNEPSQSQSTSGVQKESIKAEQLEAGQRVGSSYYLEAGQIKLGKAKARTS